jgi:uncharacterized protein
VARVIELIFYPVKGCAGISVAATAVTEAGLANDRSFMVIDEDGEARTQRRDPLLAVVRPEISTEAGTGNSAERTEGAEGTGSERLTLSVPGLEGVEPVRISVDRDSPRRDVTLFKLPYQGIDQGDEAADWFSRVLGAPSRLVRVPPEHARVSKGEVAGPVGYADGSAVLIASPPSLDLLNERLAEAGGEPLPMNRFRPNILVGGWTRPHTEDLVRQLGIGTAEFGYGKVCLRCAVTMVDQSSAKPSGPEPIRTLSGYRRASTGVAFGSLFAVTRPGRIAVGDEIHVRSWGESVVPLGHRTGPRRRAKFA